MAAGIQTLLPVLTAPVEKARSRGKKGAETAIMTWDIPSKIVRKYTAEQGIAEEEALKKGVEEKSKEFVEKGAEVYAKV